MGSASEYSHYHWCVYANIGPTAAVTNMCDGKLGLLGQIRYSGGNIYVKIMLMPKKFTA